MIEIEIAVLKATFMVQARKCVDGFIGHGAGEITLKPNIAAYASGTYNCSAKGNDAKASPDHPTWHIIARGDNLGIALGGFKMMLSSFDAVVEMWLGNDGGDFTFDYVTYITGRDWQNTLSTSSGTL